MYSKKKFVGFRCLAVRSATKQMTEFSYYHFNTSDILISMTKDIKNNITKRESIGFIIKCLLKGDK
jgi:hypothetical protein